MKPDITNLSAIVKQFDKVEETMCGDFPFATEYKLLVHTSDPKVEIIGDLSIYTHPVEK